MQVIVKREVEVKFVTVRVHVRYGEEDMPNDFPGRKGDIWEVTIELETGQILDWPADAGLRLDWPGSFDMKVVDEGSYFLLDENKKVVAYIEDGYVPNNLLPGEYGDYLNLEISVTGKITNWLKNPSLSEFED